MAIHILDSIKSERHPTRSFGIIVPTQDVSELVEGIKAEINLQLPRLAYSQKGYGGSVCFYREDAYNLTSVTPIAVTMKRYSPNDGSGNIYAAFGQDVTEIKFKAVLKSLLAYYFSAHFGQDLSAGTNFSLLCLVIDFHDPETGFITMGPLKIVQ